VLRYMTVRVDELEEGPSAVLQSRGRSDDRPRRSYGDRPYGDRPYGERGGEPRGETPAPAAEGAEA
jgi:small subunit ribosomal protein S6